MPDSDQGRVGALDALRGYAIIGVIAVHCTEAVRPGSESLLKTLASGSRGVQLFYMASAFALFISLTKQPVTNLSGLGVFWLKRAARLMPMFWLAIAVYLNFYGLKPRFWAPYGIGLNEIALTTLLLHTWSPNAANAIVPGGWSVGVEVTFYMLAPILALLVRNAWTSGALLIIAAFAAYPASVWLASLYAPFYPPGAYIVDQFATAISFPSQMPAFACGLLLYFIHRSGFRLLPLPAWCLLFGSAAGMFVVSNDTGYWFTLAGRAWLLTNLTLSTLIMAAGAAALILCPQLPLNNRLARKVGEISYSIYLLHIVLITYVIRATSEVVPIADLQGSTSGYLVFTAILLCTCLIAALATHALIEEPPRRWAARVARRQAVRRTEQLLTAA